MYGQGATSIPPLACACYTQLDYALQVCTMFALL